MPNGVQAMCIDLPGLVETSLNMGVVRLSEDNLQISLSIRSSVATAKEYIIDKVTQLATFLGGTVSSSGAYPAWPLARESKFREQCVEVYKNLYGEEPQVVTIHAGLECGILSEKIPGLDCISIGPNLKEIHTIKERASISSIARVWEFIKAVLAYK
jgi:dipeptidase D